MNLGNIRTLSGITPVESDKLEYVEPTSRVEAFLQKKFDLVIQQMNKDTKAWNDAHPDEEPRPLQEEVEVDLITTKLSSKFYPFLLILPASVLRDRTTKSNKNELDIFNPQHSERAANMKNPLYEVIKPFLYNDNDKNAFFTQTLQHELKISRSTALQLKANCRLRVHSFDKGRTQYVAVLLDPIRLLHNMCELLDNSVPFLVHINRVEQIKGGNFRYYFTYSVKSSKNKNKKDIDFANQIMRTVTNRR